MFLQNFGSVAEIWMRCVIVRELRFFLFFLLIDVGRLPLVVILLRCRNITQVIFLYECVKSVLTHLIYPD